MLRWLDVRLNDRKVEETPWPAEEVWRAGRYRTAERLLALKAYRAEPLSQENPLVLVAGPLAGTTFSNANRLSVGAKSPLTGGVKESNSGGTVAFALGQLGIAGLTLLGAAPDWTVLVIGPKGVRFEDGREFLGQGTYATVAELRRRHPKSAVAAIGPVGEYQGLLAGISVTDTDGLPGRIAGRGGLGAVMGSKRLKAIVVEGADRPPKEKKKFFDELRSYGQKLRANPVTGQYYPEIGTAGMADYQNVAGGLPVKNFRLGRLTEGANPIGGEALRDLILARDGQGTPTHACMPGCIIRCSNRFPDADGRLVVSPLEYETIGLVGSNCGLTDLDAIARVNREANDLGIDTIEFGATLAVAMDAGLAEWGDLDWMLGVAEELRAGTPEGKRFAQGAYRLGKALGVERLPTVRKQAMSAYDPRVVEGTGVTYMTSQQGADHTAGNPARVETFGMGLEEVMRLSFEYQVKSAALDALGLCYMSAAIAEEAVDLVAEAIADRHGVHPPEGYFHQLGRDVLRLELVFNRELGLPPVEPLPDFFYREPLPPTERTARLDPKVIGSFWERFLEGR